MFGNEICSDSDECLAKEPSREQRLGSVSRHYQLSRFCQKKQKRWRKNALSSTECEGYVQYFSRIQSRGAL